MAHIHGVYDTDTHFLVDPVKKELTVAEGYEKVKVIQHDHNSERFTFEMPRYIEGHDMSTCNKVEVHYLNVDSKTKEESKGLYPVDDLQISPENEDIVICSWLISGNATKYVGTLFFVLRLECNTEGTIDYALNTLIYDKIYIGEGLFNSEAIATEYADVLEKWKEELIASGGVTDEQIETAVNKYMTENPVKTGGITSTAKILLGTLLKATVYDKSVLADPKTVIDSFLAELDKVVSPDEPDTPIEPEEPEEPTVTYTVTYNLTSVMSTNNDTTVTEGTSYTTVLSSNSTIDTVVVKMGGVDITETAYNSLSNTITIAEITGDIEITATIADSSLLYQLKDASFNGQTIIDTGVSLFDESKDFTILFDFENMSCVDQSFLGIVTDDVVTASYGHFLGRCKITGKNSETETISFEVRVNGSNVVVTAPQQDSDANSRYYSAKLAITFNGVNNKWNMFVVNSKTGETTEGTFNQAVSTMSNTIALGGTTDRGKTSFGCNEFSIYNRVLSDEEISAWIQ